MVPAHAQRMSSLLGADKEFAFCRSQKGGACNGGRGACREAGERVRGGSDGMHGARLSKGLGVKGTRGAHAEHVAHVYDAGGVEAQRLVEGRRGLPS